MCLFDLENDVTILSILVRPSSLEQIKKSLQEDDDSVKTNCFKLLRNILTRAFDSDPSGEDLGYWNAPQSNNQEAKNDDLEIKKTVREELFDFMSQIVQLVIAFDLAIAPNGTSSHDKELNFTEIIGAGNVPRLGLMRLTALELLDKLQSCYGLRILEVYKDSDIYVSLMKMYAFYPYNDMALRYVTSIIAYALDNQIAKELIDPNKNQPKRISRILDMQSNSNSETAASTAETSTEDEQSRKDVLLVYMLFSTPLTELIMQMCQKREMLSFTKTVNKVEMGYVAHLTRLAMII